MKKLSKQEALEKIEELKKYVAEEETKETPKTTIYSKSGEVLFTSDKPTLKEALEEAVGQGANLEEANLWRANLQEANLREANLRGANLQRANLWRANLEGANLEEANLWRAKLEEANLEEANLEGAELSNAKFYGKGGTSKLKKDQVETFLLALGFIIED